MIPSAAARLPEVPPLAAEEVRELVSIGFHGLLNGKGQDALRLFEALTLLRPGDGFPRIGNALALSSLGRPAEAARVLEAALASRPHDDSIRLFLGMTLRFANRGHHARAVLSPLVSRCDDSSATRLARHLSDLPP
jgi:Flp pilus assembly protein TadD